MRQFSSKRGVSSKTIEFVAHKPGVFPFYCTNFCSALHQEMQGYLAVKP